MRRLKVQVRSRRERELAGDARAGSWARARARRTQRQFLAANWWRVLLVVAAILLVAVLVALFMPNDLARGIVLGAGLTGAPMAVWLITIQVTGTAGVMMGDEAEQWTAQELRKLQRQGWRLVNHFSLTNEDIDHVLVGPGGVVAIETKWSSSWDTSYGEQRLREAVAQVRENARRLRLWHPMKSQGLDVSPLVVAWGQGSTNWPGGSGVRTVDGVPVVAGRSLSTWRSELSGDALGPAQVQRLWDALNDHATTRDPLEQAANPLPASVVEVAARIGLTVAATALSFLLIGSLWSWTDSATLTVAGALAAALPAGLSTRLRYAVWPSIGWITGLTLPAAAVVLAYMLEALSGV